MKILLLSFLAHLSAASSYILMFKDNATSSSMQSIEDVLKNSYGATITNNWSGLKALSFEIPDSLTEDNFVAIESFPDVEILEEDGVASIYNYRV